MNKLKCFLIIFITTITAFSCSIMSFSYSEPIIGEWKCIAMVQDEDITPVLSSYKTNIEFLDDGNYTVNLDDKVNFSGTWEKTDYEIKDAEEVYLLNSDETMIILAVFYEGDYNSDDKLYIMINDIMLCCEKKENSVDPSIPSVDSSLPSASIGEQNALEKAKSYLSHSAFSYSGLIEQLEYSGYTNEEATFAADNCGADWYEQSLKKAKSYISHSSFSYDGLVDQLEYSGFTHDEAVYGANHCGLSESDAALEKAKSYLSHSAFSYKGLIDQLEYSGFSHEDAVKAADNCGADWYEQAEKKAASYLSHSSFSKSELISQLEYSGFTHEQAVYGANANGY